MAATTKEIRELYAALEDAKTEAPAKGGSGDPVMNFIKAAKEQKASVELAIKKRDKGENFTEDFNSRSDWYKQVRGGYRVHFGKFRISTGSGATHFKANNLEAVNALLDVAIALAESDQDFQDKITDASDKLKATLAAGKKKSNE